jgi:hypothetical protein
MGHQPVKLLADIGLGGEEQGLLGDAFFGDGDVVGDHGDLLAQACENDLAAARGMPLGLRHQGLDFVQPIQQDGGNLVSLLTPRQNEVDKGLGGSIQNGRDERRLRIGGHGTIALFQNPLEAENAIEAGGGCLNLALELFEGGEDGRQGLAVDEQVAPCPIALDREAEGDRTTRDHFADQLADVTFQRIETGRQTQPEIETAAIDRLHLAGK